VGGLLRDLPSLPSKQAILLGWATPIPVLVEIDELAKEHQPQSSDPDFWDVWTGEKKRNVNWGNVVKQWSTPVVPTVEQQEQEPASGPLAASDEASNPFTLDDDTPF
jgi:hypothetical protein